MEILRGIAVSHGIAIGTGLVLDPDRPSVLARRIPTHQIRDELQRLTTALKVSAAEAKESQKSLASRLGNQYGAIFAAHAMLFDDPSFLAKLDHCIRDELFCAEYAVSRVIRGFVKAIQDLGKDHFLASRTEDLHDIERRILSHLMGDQKDFLSDLDEPVIILAADLTPSQTAAFDSGKVFAFATESGGKASHTAILAGAMEIPAVVGLGRFLHKIIDGDVVIVDGTHGLLIIDPDDETLDRCHQMRSQERSKAGYWIAQRDLLPETRDGTRISLMGNIEFPTEGAHCMERGADGVGLYRTEFLYTGRQSDPTEAEQFDAYMTVLKEIGPDKPVVIRTLDLGADKFTNLPWLGAPEKNPYLGVRSIRLCLRNLPLFRTQIRAILRASAFGNIRILFPMISGLGEMRQCHLILSDVKEELQEEGIRFNRKIPVGTMIEVPSAALMADLLAKEVDFFSIGTNDLIQYTLAADRNNENVADLYNPADPAVLRLIRFVVESARKENVEVNVCGEMSGDPLYTILLLGMGLRQLSVAPYNIPEIKKVIRLISMDDARHVAEQIIDLDTARDITNHLHNQLRRILPEDVD